MKCSRSYTRKGDRVVKQSHNGNSNVEVFAADIMCHKSCINNYLVKYKRIVSNEQLQKR